MSSKIFLIVNAVPNSADKTSFQFYLSQIIEVFEQFEASKMQRFKKIDQGHITAIVSLNFQIWNPYIG
ncbi:hypothetical protein B0A58_00425 [Flavobacterium branchiophilum NBRC 15030 = ATCC 35035]|nr:hypothetical protein B0A58_00425 [Flavobacterium branchiophilum NBRC 15030 = ATCC 35035]